MSCHITSYHMISHHTQSHHIVSHPISSYHITSSNHIIHHIASHHTSHHISHRIISHHITLQVCASDNIYWYSMNHLRMSEWLSFAAFLGQRDPYDPYKLYDHILYNVMIIYPHMIKKETQKVRTPNILYNVMIIYPHMIKKETQKVRTCHWRQ